LRIEKECISMLKRIDFLKEKDALGITINTFVSGYISA